MMQTLTGVIHGKTIELDDVTNLADGAEVEIVIRPSRSTRRPGEGLLRTEGALADDAEWDVIMDEIQQSRRLERRAAVDKP
jgi:hypothetical protein